MFRWPTYRQRVLLAGRTGSGKTQFAAHMLSFAPFDKQPYVIIDYKSEELLNSIERARYIDDDKVPRHPGVYIYPATPVQDDDRVEAFLRKCLERERVGLFYDEGYMLPNVGALQAIYTQGRSKRVPTITLTQRPVWLSRFAFSEADFIAYLDLTDDRDRKTFLNFVPRHPVWDFSVDFPDYHVRWHDVARKASFVLLPAPDRETILERFDARLRRPARII